MAHGQVTDVTGARGSGRGGERGRFQTARIRSGRPRCPPRRARQCLEKVPRRFREGSQRLGGRQLVPRKIECRGSMRSSSSWYCRNGPTAGTAPSSAHALAATLAPPAASAAGRSRRSRVRRERTVRPSPPCSSSDSRAARVRSLPCTWCWPVKTLMPRRRSASTQANKPESCPGCTATARTARGSTRRPPRHGLQQR